MLRRGREHKVKWIGDGSNHHRKVKIIKDRIKAIQDRQKRYADIRRRPLKLLWVIEYT
jgi:hypothetical protein